MLEIILGSVILIGIVGFVIYMCKNTKIKDVEKDISNKQIKFEKNITKKITLIEDSIKDNLYKLKNSISNQEDKYENLEETFNKFRVDTTKEKIVKCLVIDDDPTILAFTSMFLRMLPNKKKWKNYKFDIVCAESCEEGIQLLSVHKFDIAIVDYRLPKKSGFYFWHFCKENKKLMNNKDELNIIIYSSSPEHALENIPREIAPHFLECKRSISNIIEKTGDMKKWNELTDKLKEMI